MKPTATSYTTSTIYSTKTHTGTKDGVKYTTTSAYPVSTTICPVSATSIKAVPTSSVYYTTSTVMGTKIHTYTEKGTTKYSTSEQAISTAVSPVTIIPVHSTASSSPAAVAAVSINTGPPYKMPGQIATAVANSTGSLTVVSPAQFTGAAGRNLAGLTVALIGAAAVVLF